MWGVSFQEVTKLFVWTKAVFVVCHNLQDALLTQKFGRLLILLVTLHDILEDLNCPGRGLAKSA